MIDIFDFNWLYLDICFLNTLIFSLTENAIVTLVPSSSKFISEKNINLKKVIRKKKHAWQNEVIVVVPERTHLQFFLSINVELLPTSGKKRER